MGEEEVGERERREVGEERQEGWEEMGEREGRGGGLYLGTYDPICPSPRVTCRLILIGGKKLYRGRDKNIKTLSTVIMTPGMILCMWIPSDR